MSGVVLAAWLPVHAVAQADTTRTIVRQLASTKLGNRHAGNLRYVRVEGAEHNSAAWRGRLPAALVCLFNP